MILTSLGSIFRNLGVFSNPADSKLTPDCLPLQWIGHSITFSTLTFDLLCRNIATLDFNTERVAETALHASWFWATSDRFLGTWGIFSSAKYSKLTLDRVGLYWNGQRKTFWTLTCELLGRNIAPLYFKIERVAESVLRASWLWQTLAPFPGT